MSTLANELERNRQVFGRLMVRNDELGLKRYDPSDLDIRWPVRWLLGRYHRRWARITQKLLKLPALVMPILWRRIQCIPRSVAPTTYYHLGNAYLHGLTWAPDESEMWLDRLRQMGAGAMADAVRPRGNACWGCGRPFFRRDRVYPPDAPCAHHTIRAAYILLKIGKRLDDPKMVAVGLEGARAMADVFNWHEKDGGQLTASYFPDSEDETINISSETAMLMAEALTIAPDEPTFRRRVEGLVRTVIAEQDDDGKWGYVTRDDYAKTGYPYVSDLVHFANTLSGLLRVLAAGALDGDLRARAVEAAGRGAEFFMRTFFRDDGWAFYTSRRTSETNVAGYCEGICCMHDLLTSPDDFGPLTERLGVQDLMGRAVQTVVDRFIDTRHWDAVSQRIGPFRINIRSVRWGSGMIMEAISRYLHWRRRGTQEGSVT